MIKVFTKQLICHSDRVPILWNNEESRLQILRFTLNDKTNKIPAVFYIERSRNTRNKYD